MAMIVFGTADGKISLNGKIYDPQKQQTLIEGDSQLFIQENPPLVFSIGDVWINPVTLKRSEPTVANGRAIWAEPYVLEKKGITDTTFNSILTPFISGVNLALSRIHSALGGTNSGSGSDTTPPTINSISSLDTNSNSNGVYSAGDRITINFNEPIDVSLLAITDITLNNNHSFGAGATLAPVNIVNGHASAFDILLGTGATVTGGDSITIPIGKVRDISGNSNTDPIVFLLPVLGGTIIAGGSGVNTPSINNISSTDIGGNSSGHYSAGDRIVINFSEPIDSTLLTISGVSVSNGHILGTGATLEPVNPTNGYATTFYLTLGTGTTVEPNDVIRFNIGTIRDADGNTNTTVVEYVLPTLGGTNTGPNGSTDIVNVNIPEEFKPIELKAIPCNDPLPNGFLETTGIDISRSVFSGMFSKIGTTYGAGDGVTTFNLPNILRLVDYKFIIGIRQVVTPPVAGTVLYLVDDAVVPDGWIITDGRCLVKEAYPELYTITGDMYGTCTNDSSMFKLADHTSNSTATKFAIMVSNNTIVPTTGSVLMQLSNEVVASGNLELDGATVDRTTYNDIFKTIGIKYGAGDNASTFKLPTSARESDYKYVMTTTDTTPDIGDIFWMDSTITPAGYVRCNGQYISKSAANALFIRIGNRFGESTDGLKFKMPTINQPVNNNNLQFIETNIMPLIGDDAKDVKVVDVDNGRFLVKYHKLDGSIYKPYLYIGKIQVDNSIVYTLSNITSSDVLPIDAEFLLLNDGRVLIMGGKNSETNVANSRLIVLSIDNADAVTSVELQDVATNASYYQDSFYTKFGISTLIDGRVVCLGGFLENDTGVNHSMIFTINASNVAGVASTSYPTAIASNTKLRRLADDRLLALGMGVMDDNNAWRSEYRFLSISGDNISYSTNGLLPADIFGSGEISSLEYAQTPDGSILIVGGYYLDDYQNNVCTGIVTGDSITFTENTYNTPFAGINYHLLNIHNNNVILAGGQIVNTNDALVSNNKVYVTGTAIADNTSDFVIRLGVGTPGLLNKTIL